MNDLEKSTLRGSRNALDQALRDAGATYRGRMSGGPDLVDWDLAAATGVRLLRPGPAVSAEEARDYGLIDNVLNYRGQMEEALKR